MCLRLSPITPWVKWLRQGFFENDVFFWKEKLRKYGNSIEKRLGRMILLNQFKLKCENTKQTINQAPREH